MSLNLKDDEYFGWFSQEAVKTSGGYAKYVRRDGTIVNVTIVTQKTGNPYAKGAFGDAKYMGILSKYISKHGNSDRR